MAIEIVLLGVCSSRSPCRSASAASCTRKGGISACQGYKEYVPARGWKGGISACRSASSLAQP
eukprot:scaffold45010_cov59-Phaeocystis_antarctica.AAC.5